MNYMEQVAELLGVEVGEKFEIINGKGELIKNIYHFDENGLLSNDGLCPYGLIRLLTGESKIKKQPWKPKPEDTVYLPEPLSPKLYAKIAFGSLVNTEWVLENKIPCKTQEEAIKMAKKWLALTKD